MFPHLPEHLASRYVMLYACYVPVKSKLKHTPPGQTPGHLNFWKIFVQIPPSRGRKAVQMPHYRSISDDQMLPPTGNFSVASIMLQSCVCKHGLIDNTLTCRRWYKWFLNTFKDSAKLVQAFAFQPVRHESDISHFDCIKSCLRRDLSRNVELARRNMKSKLTIKFPTLYE